MILAKRKRSSSDDLSKERVLAALEKVGGAARKRELARELELSVEQKPELRKLLKELEADGSLGRSGRRTFQSASALASTGVMDIIDRDGDGELIGRMRGDAGLYGPNVRLAPGEARGKRGEPAIGIGDRVLARIEKDEEGPVARVIKRLGQSAHRILGVFHADKGGGGRIEPADRKARHDLLVLPEHQGEARDGDLVLAELATGRERAHGPKRGLIKEVVGREDDPRAASILAIHTHGIPIGFSEEEEREARFAKLAELGKRTDLRDLPLITIDPEDARDHDDAVYAQPDDDPKNAGGWRVWVAIADVSHYVTPGSALERGALRRGNSTYFPDRVAPMLPERLSAHLCSLMEGEDRACLAVEMVFDKNGRKKSHRFARGLMRSAAKLSYAQAQAAIDGKPDAKTKPLLAPILKPLWAAYACMKIGRDARSPLEIDAPEHRIQFGPDGRVAGVTKRERFDAHKLIEEFMVMANVCAAETAEEKRFGLLYRIHDQPSEAKVAALMDFLPTVGMTWSKGQVVTSERFNRILELAEKSEHKEIINEVVLRTQAQAVYSPDNIGHFGLNLTKYAHFTSPIRRYSDLIVHRALISALKLGKDGQTEEEAARLGDIGEQVSMCERRSMAAERDATSRYIASFLSDRVGASFAGKVSGVTRFGLFIRLEDTQADGLAPISTLGRERWNHDEAAHALVGEDSGRRFPLGMRVEVRLEEAAPISGGLIFAVLSEPLPRTPGFKKTRQSRSKGGRSKGGHGKRGKGRRQ